MIDDAFCDFLESWICKAFRESDDPEFRHFWCDGVLMNQPAVCYSQKYINDKRETQFLAYIGQDGQTRYNLILKFGPKALSRYARGLELTECMPDPEAGFSMDPENKACVIQLH